MTVHLASVRGRGGDGSSPVSSANQRTLCSLLAVALLACSGLLAAEPGVVGEARPDASFINSWLVCGPFPQPVAFGAIIPKVGASFGGMKWEYFDDRLWNRNYDNYQDLFGYYTVRKGVDTRNKYVYAFTSVFTPQARTVEFRFGTSGTDRLFINDAEVRRDVQPQEVQRDLRKQSLFLKPGWNRILLEIRHDYTAATNAKVGEIAKDACVSYLGLYARVSDADGKEVPGVLYSVVGDAPTLAVDTQAMAASDVVPAPPPPPPPAPPAPSPQGRGLPANVLPIGYVEWPYVWNKSLYGRDARRIWADPYRFEASGGRPPYQWAIVSGALPDGLKLKADGAIDGFCERMGTFDFAVQVTDSRGASARLPLAITVKDRPNRWFEEGRVGALSHCAPVYSFWVDPNYSADLWAERARRQGHSLVSIEALQQNYYWPSKFEDPKHPRNRYQPRDKDGKMLDGLKPFGEAVKRHGLKFGLYYATGGLGQLSTDGFVQNCSELILGYDPAYLYFDGPQFMPGANYDVMYSSVRNYGDDIIINSNVSDGDGEYGDADLGTTEASGIYSGANPARFTKRIVVEPWKSAHTKNNFTPYYAKRDDFRQVVKEMIMNVGRGYVDNNDQMPLMSRGPNWDSPAEIANRYPKSIQEFSDLREGTAGWFVPPGKPERHESTTGTVPYFLAGCGYEDDGAGNLAAFNHGKGPAWGYPTARDNAIYLHFISGPDGKQGWSGEPSVTISPVPDRVLRVSWLNEDQPLAFEQRDRSLTIMLAGITVDPLDTIVKIVTANPRRKYKLTNLVATGLQLAPDTFQARVEGYMTYPALQVPFARGAVHFASSDPSVATVNGQGLVQAIGPGKATIAVEGAYEGSSASNALAVLVDASRNIRVDDTLVGVGLKVDGKEAYLACAGTGDLPFTLEGRSKRGGPISLHTAKVTMKCGVVDYAQGTPWKPVYIEEQPVCSFKRGFSGGTLSAIQARELTRVAVWAEVDLDGVKAASNKVFLDLEPLIPLLGSATAITASGHLGDFTPDRVQDGVLISRDGSDHSKWSVSGKGPSWIAFDLQQPGKISQANLHFNTLEQVYINPPDTMEIQASPDGVQWRTIAALKPPAAGQGAFFGFADVFHFKPVVTRHVRLYFPKGNSKGESVDLLEVKLYTSIVNNLALTARIATSSICGAGYAPENVADGIIGEHGRGEWSSQGEANPWLRLEWDGNTSINRIVLYDRPNANDHLRQGTLLFNDGSHIDVTDIPNDGSPSRVVFPVKTVQWVKFQATGNNPGNNGLSEFEVFGPE